jgi:leucyl-tRNA synthetase
MDTFFDSCWYLLRYLSPKEDNIPFTKEASDYWMPVDLYIGGIEHAVMHLLYFRFFSMVLMDLGLVSYEEPVKKLLTQGMVIKDGDKMSKSKGNVVDPDELVEQYGSDTARLFMLFASPPERDLDWSQKGIEGCFKFLKRIHRTVDESLDRLKNAAPITESMTLSDLTQDQIKLIQKTHETIRQVTMDIEKRLHFNTAISAIMELVNEITRYRRLDDPSETGVAVLREAVLTVLSLLSPFAPHLAEELWERCGQEGELAGTPWPVFRDAFIEKDTVTIVVQVNGKKRAEVAVSPPDIDQDRLLADFVLSDQRVRRHLEGKEVIKNIYVPGKLVNLVVK